MTREAVLTLLGKGEGQRIEFKEGAIKPSDLAETLIAFANAQGGIVLLGVDDRGAPVGVPSVSQVHDLVLTAASAELCDPPVRLSSVTPVSMSDGREIVVVAVPRSRRLHSTHGRFLIRRGARNVALSTAEVSDRSRYLDTGGIEPLQLAAGYGGLYEVIDYEVRLDLLDVQGKEAVLERTQEIRFLQNGVVGIYHQVWGEGDLFADYEVEPGIVADRFRLGSRYVNLISLREVKNRGDVLRLRMRRRIRDGWTGGEEWFETAVTHRTRMLKLAVVFPVERPPRQATLSEESTGTSTMLDRRHWRIDEQGRWTLIWRKRHPSLGETYVLRWRW